MREALIFLAILPFNCVVTASVSAGGHRCYRGNTNSLLMGWLISAYRELANNHMASLKQARFHFPHGLIACFFGVLFFSSGAQADNLKNLIAAGQYVEAYDAAQLQLDDRLGDPDFDFLYGMAALETGHPQEALFAFERVLMERPYDLRAKLELARAHHILGNLETSERLFSEVKASQPPPLVQSNIQRFLDVIRKQRESSEAILSMSLTLTGGNDSNVNSATELSTIDSAFFGVITLDSTSVANEDQFFEMKYDVNYMKLVRKDFAWFVGGNAAGRRNSTVQDLNTREFGFTGGGAFTLGKHSFRLPLQTSRLDLDNKRFRNMNSLGLEWGMSINKEMTTAAFLQYGQMRYPDQANRDVDLSLIGGAFTSRWPGAPVTLLASAYFGEEDNKLAAGAFNARKYTGWRLGSIWNVNAKHEASLTYVGRITEHTGFNAYFRKYREDDTTQVTFSWKFQLTPKWMTSFTIDRTKNPSNIDIYAYKRTQMYVSAKYAF